MPAATIRRSLVRGLVAVLLMALGATSAMAQDPVELHVIGRGGDTAEADAGADARMP